MVPSNYGLRIELIGRDCIDLAIGMVNRALQAPPRSYRWRVCPGSNMYPIILPPRESNVRYTLNRREFIVSRSSNYIRTRTPAPTFRAHSRPLHA